MPRDLTQPFRIALSFPGEDRDFVLRVAKTLEHAIGREEVFYDEWYETELLGSNGDIKLQDIYANAKLIVPFFSQHYVKPWCELEWDTIRGVLLTRRADDAVIPVHLDATKIEGWSVVNFGLRVKDRTPEQIAKILLDSLELREKKVSGAILSTTAPNDARATDDAAKSREITDAEFSLLREVRDYLELHRSTASGDEVKKLTDRLSKTDRDIQAEQKRRKLLASERLRLMAEEVLDSSEDTLRFIIKCNRLPEVKAAEVAKRIFANEQPLSFVYNCVRRKRIKASIDNLAELSATICKLVEIIAPVCFTEADLRTLQQHLDQSAPHARVQTSDPLVAKSQVAFMKRVSVSLEDGCQLPDDEREIVVSLPHPPELGIHGDGSDGREDIVDEFVKALIKVLNPRFANTSGVRAALKNLADIHEVYLCVLFPTTLSDEALQRLNEQLPHLILLTAKSSQHQDEDEEDGEHIGVLDQIHQIRKEFGPAAQN